MLLIDADILVYRLGYSLDKEPDLSRRNVEHSVVTAINIMLCDAAELTGHDEAEFYLTGKTNFRKKIATTAAYKANRPKEKPKYYKLIRDFIIDKYEGIVSKDQEADDCIAIRATELDNAVICSIDKDFDQVPGWHYNWVKHKNPQAKREDYYYEISPQEGLLYFYRQILTGDRIDNIIGLDGIGPVKSKKILEGLTEMEMYQKCVELYKSEERVIENARLLWLRREEGQLWKPPHEDTQQEKEKNKQATKGVR